MHRPLNPSGLTSQHKPTSFTQILSALFAFCTKCFLITQALYSASTLTPLWSRVVNYMKLDHHIEKEELSVRFQLIQNIIY